MTAPGATTIRDALKAISPTWLQTGTGERFVYMLGLTLDQMAEGMRQGMLAHIPGLGTPDALPIIGQDDQIQRGLTESDAGYGSRLQTAYDVWALAGSAWGVLRNALAYVLAYLPAGRTVTDSSIWDSYTQGQAALFTVRAETNTLNPPTHFVGSSNWNWDNEGDPHPVGKNAWWRWWLVLFSTGAQQWVKPGPNCGAGNMCGDPTISCGLSAPASVMQGMQSLVKRFQREGSWCRWIIVSFDATLFDPGQSADGTHNPAGTFAHWGHTVNNQYVSARFTNARYCDGAF